MIRAISLTRMMWFCVYLCTSKAFPIFAKYTSYLTESKKMPSIVRCTIILGFHSHSVVKNPPAMQEIMGLIPGSGRSPGQGNDNPLQYSCLGKSYGQRSLAGYKRWKMTLRLHHHYFVCQKEILPPFIMVRCHRW